MWPAHGCCRTGGESFYTDSSQLNLSFECETHRTVLEIHHPFVEEPVAIRIELRNDSGLSPL